MSSNADNDIQQAYEYAIKLMNRRKKKASIFYNENSKNHQMIKNLENIGLFSMLEGKSILAFYEQYRNRDICLYVMETHREGDHPYEAKYDPITITPIGSHTLDELSLVFGGVLRLCPTYISESKSSFVKNKISGQPYYNQLKFGREVNKYTCNLEKVNHKVNVVELNFSSPYDIYVYDNLVSVMFTTNHPFITADVTINNINSYKNFMSYKEYNSEENLIGYKSNNGLIVSKNDDVFFIENETKYSSITNSPECIYIRNVHHCSQKYLEGTEYVYYVKDLELLKVTPNQTLQSELSLIELENKLNDLKDNKKYPSKCSGIKGISVSKIMGKPLQSRYNEIVSHISSKS